MMTVGRYVICLARHRSNSPRMLRYMQLIIIIKFLTTDNAFRPLWLVYSILVISSYTLVWPYTVNDCAKCWYKAKNVFAGKRNFSLNKPKKEKKNFFVESLDKCRRLEVRQKARNVFCDEPTSVWPQGVTQHRTFIKLGFSRFFRSYFYLKILEFKELKQLFHSRLLDMRLVIANSALRASLAIY